MREQLIVLFIFIFTFQSNAQALAGTDDLGRVLPLNDSVGNPREDKQVAIFYFLWQGDKNSEISEKYWDLSEIVPKHPEVLEDFDSEFWGSQEVGSFYFWGKPIYGYYRGDDYWVHLRSIQLLTDADVDVLVIDATNAFIYPKQAHALMKAMDAVRAQGKILVEPLWVIYCVGQRRIIPCFTGYHTSFDIWSFSNNIRRYAEMRFGTHRERMGMCSACTSISPITSIHHLYQPCASSC